MTAAHWRRRVSRRGPVHHIVQVSLMHVCKRASGTRHCLRDGHEEVRGSGSERRSGGKAGQSGQSRALGSDCSKEQMRRAGGERERDERERNPWRRRGGAGALAAGGLGAHNDDDDGEERCDAEWAERALQPVHSSARIERRPPPPPLLVVARLWSSSGTPSTAATTSATGAHRRSTAHMYTVSPPLRSAESGEAGDEAPADPWATLAARAGARLTIRIALRGSERTRWRRLCLPAASLRARSSRPASPPPPPSAPPSVFGDGVLAILLDRALRGHLATLAEGCSGDADLQQHWRDA